MISKTGELLAVLSRNDFFGDLITQQEAVAQRGDIELKANLPPLKTNSSSSSSSRSSRRSSSSRSNGNSNNRSITPPSERTTATSSSSSAVRSASNSAARAASIDRCSLTLRVIEFTSENYKEVLRQRQERLAIERKALRESFKHSHSVASTGTDPASPASNNATSNNNNGGGAYGRKPTLTDTRAAGLWAAAVQNATRKRVSRTQHTITSPNKIASRKQMLEEITGRDSFHHAMYALQASRHVAFSPGGSVRNLSKPTAPHNNIASAGRRSLTLTSLSITEETEPQSQSPQYLTEAEPARTGGTENTSNGEYKTGIARLLAIATKGGL
jgi:hypothetical protein